MPNAVNKILSLIVPSYNMEAYLPRCLDSVLACDAELCRKIEIIVVNDGSRDGTLAIARDYERRFPGIVCVIDKHNGHYGSCVNAALNVAAGTFVKLLDADDYFDGEQFGRFLDAIVSASDSGKLDEVDALITPYSSVDDAGLEIAVKRYGYLQQIAFGPDVFERELSFHILHQGIAFRRAVLAKIGYRQSEGCPYTDLEWVTYPMRAVRGFYYLPYSIYRYFIGREDQSVNPVNFEKGVGVIAKLMVRMLKDYQQLIDPERPAVEAYVRKVILAQLKIVYHSYLLERNRYLSRDEILAMDAAVKENAPALYAETDSELAPSRRFKFHYVREFRRAGSRDTWRFAALRMYSAMMKLLRR